MARSCGLRIGPRRYELVVLDGSPKKHKIAAYAMGELPVGDEGAVAALLKAAMKEHGVPADNVGVAVDTGMAAFRTLKVPFSDRAKIEEVVKFEVESHLPQWNIDDVIIDFHVLESSDDYSELLVSAVPKGDLKHVLGLLEKAGTEPLEAELETSAMVNAALASDLCTADNAQVLVHVGEASTSVVVIDGRRVREMRAIRIGALATEPAAAGAAEGEVESEAEASSVLEPRDPEETARRLEAANKRIRRELGRTVSAARTLHPIEAVYVCGFELPGLVGSRIQDAEVRPLDVFQKDGGQPAEGFGPLVVAYGVALRQLGGGELTPHLRREELRYAGAFEKVELPLAVVALLAVTLIGVWFIFLVKESQFAESKLGFWRDSSQRFLVGDLKAGRQGYLVYPSDPVQRYLANLDADKERTKFEQLQYVNGQLKNEIRKLEKDLGQDAEITQPQSALVGASLLLGVLESEVQNGGRPSLRKLQSTYTIGKQGKPDYVRVVLDVVFFASDTVQATQNYEDFLKAVEAQPWCRGQIDRRPSTSNEDGKGIFVVGLAIEVDVSKADIGKS
ncbi:MAG: pilus assembly protein PilM [Planctomycetes bacterium]|nr:pilus assembly protein PilM [Planctomycetota bacterium]